MTARVLSLLFFLPAFALAQENDLRLPISLDADSTDYDGKSSMLMFRGLRLSQGKTNIEADVGRASKLDFKDNVWLFNGNVIIDVDAGHIECDSAELSFTDTRLRVAAIEGSPATFELRRPGSDEVTFAQAGRLEYDLDAGVVEFSGEAVITEGGNQISSNFLIYNIQEQRINAQSTGNGEDKVKITVTPEAASDNDGVDPESDSSSEEALP
jgi:lipopolysaccharide export system protein LptA